MKHQTIKRNTNTTTNKMVIKWCARMNTILFEMYFEKCIKRFHWFVPFLFILFEPSQTLTRWRQLNPRGFRVEIGPMMFSSHLRSWMIQGPHSVHWGVSQDDLGSGTSHSLSSSLSVECWALSNTQKNIQIRWGYWKVGTLQHQTIFLRSLENYWHLCYKKPLTLP